MPLYFAAKGGEIFERQPPFEVASHRTAASRLEPAYSGEIKLKRQYKYINI